MEVTVDGDLELILKEGEEWGKNGSRKFDVGLQQMLSAQGAARISLYGIPCHVRNKAFVEVLISDIGLCINFDPIMGKPERLDVLSLMIFTNEVESIRSKITVCLDGKWINILIMEEAMVSMDEPKSFSEEGSMSSEMDDYSFSESEKKDEDYLKGKHQHNYATFLERKDGDSSLQG